MIVVFDTLMSKSELTKILKQVRKACGAGGTVKGDTIEIQGDHREKMREALEQQGIQVKWAGG